MDCKVCGAKLTENSDFCKVCGAPAAQEEGSAQSVRPAPGPEKRPRRGMPFNIPAAVFAVVAVVGIFIELFSYPVSMSHFDLLGRAFSMGIPLFIVAFLVPVLLIMVNLTTAFLPRRISWVFGLLGFSSVVAEVAILALTDMSHLLVLQPGFYLMIGGLLLSAFCQLFYKPRH